MGNFVHLHLHSEYSLLDGACRIADIPKMAKEAGHNSVAITDHGVMYGVVEFYKACKNENIKPIIGCEVYVARRSRFDREKEFDSGSNHLILLVENETGYRNLISLVSAGFTEGFYSKPRIDLEILEEHTEGLICLSACLAGAIPRSIIAGEYDKAEEYAARLDKMFGRGNFYLELQDHGLRDDNVVNEGIHKISKKLGIPMVVTNDVHYLKKTDAENQAVLMCIQTGNVIADGRPIGFETDEFYYKSTSEMESLFSEDLEACENTQRIADRCSFDFSFGQTKLPRYKPENGMKPEEFLLDLAKKGLEKKVLDGHIIFDEKYPEELYLDRLNYEFSVIRQMGYCEYYLIVWDFVHHAKREGIPVGPGRGSGAGSLIAYLIGITDIDSLRFNLLFERFLNPERVSMPDFDIDFCYNRRDEAIAYVREKYGSDHTAQIVTFGTLAARAAIRDVGRALGMSYNDVDEVAREIPQTPGITLEKAIEQNPKIKEMSDRDTSIRRLIAIATALEGMPRHASTHAAGVVITEDPVVSYVPVSVNNDIIVTQFDMDTIAELGLLKFDFLALRYLTIIHNAEQEIAEKDPTFDISKVDINDTATYSNICSGHCDGVFQLESAGMRLMLAQLKPRCLDDIIAAIALYRPGPMDSIPKYIEARSNPESIQYCSPKLAPILDVTYGCIVYQEQVMQIFREIAGYSFGHADVVRRAISKKKQHVLESERQAFINGAVEKGISEIDAISLFDDIVSFANYAFNKSHAAAYAVLSFRTAYLKTHFPLEYESALITSVQSSSDKLSEYIADCKKQGITVLSPDINLSHGSFHVEGNAIRFGLNAIKGIGDAMVSAIVAERDRAGLFNDIDDFFDRVPNMGINKRQLESLIKSGCLDSMGIARSMLLAVYESAFDRNLQSESGKMEGQIGIFDDTPQITIPKKEKIAFPSIPELSTRELLAMEKEYIGVYLNGHVLDDFSIMVSKIKPYNISDIIDAFKHDDDMACENPSENINKLKDKSQVTIVGMIMKRVNKATRAGDQMAFVTLEDRTSSIELLCFPKVFQKYSYLLNFGSVIGVAGTISAREDEDVKILVSKVFQLISDSENTVPENSDFNTEAVSRKDPPEIQKIYLRVMDISDEKYRRAYAFCEIFSGNIPVIFYSVKEQHYSEQIININPTPFVISELRSILGDDNVVLR